MLERNDFDQKPQTDFTLRATGRQDQRSDLPQAPEVLDESLLSQIGGGTSAPAAPGRGW